MCVCDYWFMKKFIDDFLFKHNLYLWGSRAYFVIAIILFVTAFICFYKNLFFDAVFSILLSCLAYFFKNKLLSIQYKKEIGVQYAKIRM
jgi:hypothetical protein